MKLTGMFVISLACSVHASGLEDKDAAAHAEMAALFDRGRASGQAAVAAGRSKASAEAIRAAPFRLKLAAAPSHDWPLSVHLPQPQLVKLSIIAAYCKSLSNGYRTPFELGPVMQIVRVGPDGGDRKFAPHYHNGRLRGIDLEVTRHPMKLFTRRYLFSIGLDAERFSEGPLYPGDRVYALVWKPEKACLGFYCEGGWKRLDAGVDSPAIQKVLREEIEFWIQSALPDA